ncbi:MAG: methylated-DNA--[protein]-cysteine S-methyltransferase [Methylococcaceae bacterium]
MSFFIDEFSSPVGNLVIRATDGGIFSIHFNNLLSGEKVFPNSKTEKAKELLSNYFEGKSVDLNSLSIHWHGTPFQILVWQTLQKIPFGEIRNYEEIAIQVRGNKNARAVGQAIGKNPILILIPCHRVIGKNGKLTGFSGGIERKEWLLNFEKRLLKKQINFRNKHDRNDTERNCQ